MKRLTVNDRREATGAEPTPKGVIEKGSPLGSMVTKGCPARVDEEKLGLRGFDPTRVMADPVCRSVVETLTHRPAVLRVRTGNSEDDMVKVPSGFA